MSEENNQSTNTSEDNTQPKNLENQVETRTTTRPFYKRPTFYFGLYLGASIVFNTLSHTVNYAVAHQQEQKANYGPNLKKAWRNYSIEELSDITSYKLLIPLSAFNSRKKPLSMNVYGNGKLVPVDINPEGGIEIKIFMGEK